MAKAESAFWDKETVVAQVTRSGHEQIVVKLVERRNRAYVDVRTWWTDPHDPNDKVLKPSPKGLTIPIEAARDVAKAIERAAELDEESAR